MPFRGKLRGVGGELLLTSESLGVKSQRVFRSVFRITELIGNWICGGGGLEERGMVVAG